MHWDYDFCICFADIQCMMMCPDGQTLHPQRGCDCISWLEYYSLNECTQKECDKGFYWSEDRCMCLVEAQCKKLCPQGQALDPREICECIPVMDIVMINDCPWFHDIIIDPVWPIDEEYCPHGLYWNDEHCMCFWAA
jgi:hypothetical protein